MRKCLHSISDYKSHAHFYSECTLYNIVIVYLFEKHDSCLFKKKTKKTQLNIQNVVLHYNLHVYLQISYCTNKAAMIIKV